MTDWRLEQGPAVLGQERWRNLPKPTTMELSGPEKYLPGDELLDAINTSILLGQPILLTGEPGCGKTEVGDYVAWKLNLGKAIRFDIKSTTTARDLFYTYDTIARFHAAQDRSGSVDPIRFAKFGGLGLAILFANKPVDVARFLPQDIHPGQRRSVVLIDEIDKAPPDVPNDLLMEIASMQFYMPEAGVTIAAEKDLRPIVVITSNSERTLPGPFLRRCIYHDIAFPKAERLKEIVTARIGDFPIGSDLLSDAISFFFLLRSAGVQKKPSTAELLAFVLMLRAKGYRADERLVTWDKRWKDIARHTLLKSSEDVSLTTTYFN